MLGTVTLLAEVLRRHLNDGNFEGLGPVNITTTGGTYDAPEAVRLVLAAARLVTLRTRRDELLDATDVTDLVDDLLALETLLCVREPSR
jgi:hypothetical protein